MSIEGIARVVLRFGSHSLGAWHGAIEGHWSLAGQ